MEYKANCCRTCGCESLKVIDQKIDADSIFYTYQCSACGETFSTETSFLEKQKQEQQATVRKFAEAPARNTPMDAAEVYRQNREKVVEIVADKGDAVSSGTGMIVGNGLVLTNAHVVLARDDKNGDYYECDSVEGIFSGKEKTLFRIVKIDAKRDMALLSSNIGDAPAVTFSEREITIGEKVFAIGNSKGQGICILDGIVSAKDRMIGGERYLMYSAPTVGGNSGGPLFNDQGEVIGMVTLGQKDGTLMNYAIPVDVLKDFVK